MTVQSAPSKYALKEGEYFKLFFDHVYEIASRVHDGEVTSELGIEMINAFIGIVEDLTIETPIQDYEKAMEDTDRKYAIALQNYNTAEAEYITREDDLMNLLEKQRFAIRTAHKGG